MAHFIPVIQKTSLFVIINILMEGRVQGIPVVLSQLKLLNVGGYSILLGLL